MKIEAKQRKIVLSRLNFHLSLWASRMAPHSKTPNLKARVFSQTGNTHLAATFFKTATVEYTQVLVLWSIVQATQPTSVMCLASKPRSSSGGCLRAGVPR